MIFRKFRTKRHIKKFGSKHIGYFNYFDAQWFSENQNTLLWLLNSSWFKKWFRWTLRIHDCKEPISKITPSTYWFGVKQLPNGKVEVKIDHRIGNQFSKRMYYAFRPLWYLLHAIDTAVQRTITSEFSFGFDELTVKTGAAYSSPNYDWDADLYNQVNWAESGLTWNDCITSANASSYSATAVRMYCWATKDGGSYYCGRPMMRFYTASIPDEDYEITAAYVAIYIEAIVNNNNVTHVIVSSNAAANDSLAASDYSTYGSTNYASIDGSSAAASQYNNINLNSTGLAAISKTGLTKYGMRTSLDIGNVAPTSDNYLQIKSCDYWGTDYAPKLVVTYVLPSTFIPKIMIF
jgi:hypothetical protein